MKNSGIYGITNSLNQKIYIGQTLNMKQRWKHHRVCLRSNSHKNSYLQNAWNLYGEENFTFVVLEQCEPELLENKEEYWMNFYDSCNRDKGFNLKQAGKHGGHSIETRKKMSEHSMTLESYGFSVNPFGKGSKHSAETKELMSEIRSGSRNGMFGKQRTDEEKTVISQKLRKLTDEQILEVYHRANNNEKVRDLAREYGVAHSVVSRIKTRKGNYDKVINELLEEAI